MAIPSTEIGLDRRTNRAKEIPADIKNAAWIQSIFEEEQRLLHGIGFPAELRAVREDDPLLSYSWSDFPGEPVFKNPGGKAPQFEAVHTPAGEQTIGLVKMSRLDYLVWCKKCIDEVRTAVSDVGFVKEWPGLAKVEQKASMSFCLVQAGYSALSAAAQNPTFALNDLDASVDMRVRKWLSGYIDSFRAPFTGPGAFGMKLAAKLYKGTGFPLYAPVSVAGGKLNILATFVAAVWGREMYLGKASPEFLARNWASTIPAFTASYAERRNYHGGERPIGYATPDGIVVTHYARHMIPKTRTIIVVPKPYTFALRPFAVSTLAAMKQCRHHVYSDEQNRKFYKEMRAQGLVPFQSDYKAFDKHQGKAFLDAFISDLGGDPRTKSLMTQELGVPVLLPARSTSSEGLLYPNAGRSMPSGSQNTTTCNNYTSTCLIQQCMGLDSFGDHDASHFGTKYAYQVAGDDVIGWVPKGYDIEAFDDRRAAYGFRPESAEGWVFLMKYQDDKIMTNIMSRMVYSLCFPEYPRLAEIVVIVAIAAQRDMLNSHPLQETYDRCAQKLLDMGVTRFSSVRELLAFASSQQCIKELQKYALEGDAKVKSDLRKTLEGLARRVATGVPDDAEFLRRLFGADYFEEELYMDIERVGRADVDVGARIVMDYAMTGELDEAQLDMFLRKHSDSVRIQKVEERALDTYSLHSDDGD